MSCPTSVTQTFPSPILPVRAAFDDRVDDPVDVVVVDDQLDPGLRHEVDRVLGAPVHLGVAALAAEALHLGDGHALDTGALEGVLDLVEP